MWDQSNQGLHCHSVSDVLLIYFGVLGYIPMLFKYVRNIVIDSVYPSVHYGIS